jgi:hypothetical protein
MSDQEVQESSNINLEITLGEIQEYFPAFSDATTNISSMKFFMLNNSISNMIRRKVGWTVSNDTYEYVINAPEYSRVKNEVDSITDPVLLVKFNIFCVRNIMHFLRPTLVEHMGEVEATEKLNNVWQMALPNS